MAQVDRETASCRVDVFEASAGNRRKELTFKQICKQNKNVLDDIGMLSCRLENASLARAADKQGCVAIEVRLNKVGSLLGILGLVYRADTGMLVFCEGTGSNGAIPGDRTLTDVALEGSQVSRRVERHCGQSRSCSSGMGGTSGEGTVKYEQDIDNTK